MGTFSEKLISILFGILLSVQLCAADFEEDGISYGVLSEDERTVEVANNNSAYVGDVVIPARVTHEGITYKVTAIHFQAFFKCTELHSVSIPATVSDMGQYSFTQCTSLQSVDLPANATDIPDGMFWGCSSLKSVTLPANIVSIGDYAFANCTSLEDVSMPDGVEYIGKAALMGTALKAFDVPHKVVDLSPFVLALTTKLETINIHDRVETIGECAFQGNTAVRMISLPDGLKSIDASAFAQCPALTSITIPDGIGSLPEKCFYNDMALQKVVLGRNVTEIGTECFARYKNTTAAPQLQDVYLLGDAVVSGGDAFIDEACGNATLHVKAELVETYRSQSGWQRFGSIVAISDDDFSGISSIEADCGNRTAAVYTVDGKRLAHGKQSVVVAGGKKFAVSRR